MPGLWTLRTRLLPLTLIVVVLALVARYWLDAHIVSRLRTPPKRSYGLVQVVVPEVSTNTSTAKGVDVIMVHGLGSNPDTTWSYPDSQKDYDWISGFLPFDLPQEFAQTTRMYYYNYDSYWQRDALDVRLWSLGRDLLQELCDHMISDSERDLVFVGHSFGGLLIKQALVQSTRTLKCSDVANKTTGIIFLGTPHRGSYFGRYGQYIARLLSLMGANDGLLAGLEYDSYFLKDLQSDFVSKLIGSMKIWNYYEQRKTSLFKTRLWHWGVLLVNEQSATFDAPQVVNVGMPVSHSLLNKFKSRDVQYQKLLRNIVDLLRLKSERDKSTTPEPIFLIPKTIVSTYVERRAVSALLDEKLENSYRSNFGRRIVVHGIAGSGKTQLVLDYVRRYSHIYSHVIWVNAETESTLHASFAVAHAALKFDTRPGVPSSSDPGMTVAQEVTTRIVLAWLNNSHKSSNRWLVVLDNVDDYSWDIGSYIPYSPTGTVILTSRDRFAREIFATTTPELLVDKLEASESIELLTQGWNFHNKSTTSGISEDINHIINALDGFAIVLDIYATQIRRSSDPASTVESLSNRLSPGRLLSDMDRNIVAVWESTVYLVQQHHRASIPLLYLLAHLEASNIPYELFRLAALGHESLKFDENQSHQLPVAVEDLLQLKRDGTWDTYAFDQALIPLYRYHLAHPDDSEEPTSLSIHHLIQEYMQSYGRESLGLDWITTFFKAALRQTQIEKNIDALPMILPHLAKLGSFMGHMPIYQDTWMQFIGPAYCTTTTRKQLDLMQYMSTGMSRAYGPTHWITLNSLEQLASHYQETGETLLAAKTQMSVVEARHKDLGAVHKDTYESTTKFLNIIRSAASLESVQAFEKNMYDQCVVATTNHPSMNQMIELHNLAFEEWKRGNFAGANSFMNQASAVFSKANFDSRFNRLRAMLLLDYTLLQSKAGPFQHALRTVTKTVNEWLNGTGDYVLPYQIHAHRVTSLILFQAEEWHALASHMEQFALIQIAGRMETPLMKDMIRLGPPEFYQDADNVHISIAEYLRTKKSWRWLQIFERHGEPNKALFKLSQIYCLLPKLEDKVDPPYQEVCDVEYEKMNCKALCRSNLLTDVFAAVYLILESWTALFGFYWIFYGLPTGALGLASRIPLSLMMATPAIQRYVYDWRHDTTTSIIYWVAASVYPLIRFVYPFVKGGWKWR